MRLLHFISASNPGLKHVREIYLRLEKLPATDKQRRFNPDDSSDDDDGDIETAVPGGHAQFTLGLLLSILPRNVLEIFRYVLSPITFQSRSSHVPMLHWSFKSLI